MEYMIVLSLSILATAKMAFQTAFSKKNIINSTDALFFSIYFFFVAAIIFLPEVFGCSPAVWIYAAVSASLTIGYQLFYTKALSVGNVSLTVLTVNFSMVINVIASYVFFGESISYVRFFAIVLTIISFVICNSNNKKEKSEKNWMMFTILAMIFHSLASISQKVFGESIYSAESQANVSCLYIMATLISVIIYQFMRKKEKRTFKVGFDMIKYGAGVGITLGIYQAFYTFGLANIDGTFLFPAQTGGLIIFSTLSGVLLFKDKLTKKQLVGVALGLISLVLMSY